MKKYKKRSFWKSYHNSLKLMKFLCSFKRNYRKIKKTAALIRKKA